ncbi:uncharacterized protein LOC135940528 [Cloeon dipterum]|uniref:uncharacterized protein LOC135940528 n=1 Tax=Cloeon dipterum TaxID=197152 RepID=UPI00321FF49C
MGLLDKRLLFSCLVVGIFAIIFLQGAEGKSKRSVDGPKWFDHSKYRNRFSTTGGYYDGGSHSGSEKMPWSWWRFVLVLLFVFGILILAFMVYFYCCYDHSPEEDDHAARVANFLKNQEEQSKSDLPTTVHPPVTYPGPDNEPPSAPAMTPPQHPEWGTSDVPSFAPPDFATATAPLLPPGVQPVDSSTNPPRGAPTLPSSSANTTSPQIGFIIPPQDPANASVHFGGRVAA